MTDLLEEVRARLVGRVGVFTEDRRHPTFALRTILGPGPQTGSEGDTVDAHVTIQEVTGTADSQGAELSVSYAGQYVRQGYVAPGGYSCIQDPTGHEVRAVYGKIPLSIKERFLRSPNVTIGEIQSVGEVIGIDHDSNQCAKRAIYPVIASLFA